MSGACFHGARRNPSTRTQAKEMDGNVLNLAGRWCASLLILLAAMTEQYLPSSVQDIALAAEELESSTPPTPQPEHGSPCSDKRSIVEVPILVYHHVQQSLPVGSRVERRLTVTVKSFDQQMRYLKDEGYHVITLDTLVDCLRDGSELPAKPVIISFDDGWEDQFEYALPALEKYHYRATFFVVTNFVGARGFFSLPQLQEIRAQGMEIGSHSRSHPHLDKTNNPSLLWDQIYTSKQILERQLGVAVDEFAYPYGSYNATTASIVRSAGYKSARACCVGRIQTDVYALRAMMAPNDLANFVKYLGARTPFRPN
jgi:peptidoglycan/xylan/chitin deacetylase (PgdA/CDA1 family)